MARIVAVGSLNVDWVVRVERWPGAGETCLGERLDRFPGGKGANQAAAAAALGGDVALVGRVGDDADGRLVLDSLRGFGVDVGPVAIDPVAATGVALVAVEAGGENRIVVLPGANGRLGPEDVLRAPWSEGRVLLAQLECPLAAVAAAARQARARGLQVLLDPSPPQALPADLWPLIDVLTPNRLEAEALTGSADPAVAAARLLQRGAVAVIVKLGAEGAWLATRDGAAHFPGVPVRAVDTTAAGDAFAGALGCALAGGDRLETAVPFANRAAALSTTRVGAQPSLPRRSEIDA